MAQGSLKLKKNNKSKGGKEKKGVVKKGARKIAPKQPALVQKRALDKKLTAQINRSIERQMSVKANAVGKLTIMKKLAEEKTEDKKIKRSSNSRLT
ncbi:hypothetical protein BCV72DRAFT_216750 [Rhizopus microsporus var. microsporus]|uniref:Uncharacterized protein n=2 Tax=Rhizopus microsporus TaxID=58291 RepID=A0A2G4SP32_RHIZD|nr:uncharacterized protein RHIMIDRAFT_239345 [Rhizopus microsporus ATCC 52813]ORE01714.1 hypothetical protein BCV72DRAFT_216750 [Rhizopus microsporus var. microsporus]PHZ10520.1 hypothetical protein RHIMIDRAFT_239345 [Rhizopus microsporus ATCC 52813]